MSEGNTTPLKIESGSKSFSAVLVSLFLAGFSIFSSLYCVQPMMPLFAEFFHVSPTHSSFPLSFSTIALAIGLLFTGFISDYFGRKPIMVFSLFSLASLLIFSPFLPIWELFLLTRMLIGIAVSGVAAVAITYIGEEIVQKDIGYAIGLYIAGTAIGGMSGRLIAGILVDYISWQQALSIIGILNFIIAIIFYLFLPKSKFFKSYPIHFSRLKISFIKSFEDKKLRILFLQGFILMGCFVSIFNYMSYHLLEKPFEVSQSLIGLISIAYLAGIYSSPKAAYWGNKMGQDHILTMMLMVMIGAIFIMLIPIIWCILLGLIIFTFAFFAAHSTASSWVSTQALSYRAVGSSLYLFCYYLGSSVLGSGSGSGIIWENFGWSGLSIFLIFILCLGVILAQYLNAKLNINKK